MGGLLAGFYADKICGVSWYGGFYEIITDTYEKNDMGFLSLTNNSQAHIYYVYNKFNPFWRHFKQGNITLYANRSGRLSIDNRMRNFNAGLNFFLLFNSNWSIYADAGIEPLTGLDYYETRLENRFYKTPKYAYGSINFTTDYNRTLAFDFGSRYTKSLDMDYRSVGYYIIPMVRVSDKFNFKISHYLDVYENDRGFAFLKDPDSSFFGSRDIITVINSVSSRYIFKNDMSLSLTARHYWSKGIYDRFYLLQYSGDLAPASIQDDLHAYDFNSNYLTIDLVYNWQFAPGSSFLITYKNLILSDTGENIKSYFTNLQNTFSDPQINSISLKVLYYLDYQYFVRKKG
jgi:hypothetical protein